MSRGQHGGRSGWVGFGRYLVRSRSRSSRALKLEVARPWSSLSSSFCCRHFVIIVVIVIIIVTLSSLRSLSICPHCRSFVIIVVLTSLSSYSWSFVIIIVIVIVSTLACSLSFPSSNPPYPLPHNPFSTHHLFRLSF